MSVKLSAIILAAGYSSRMGGMKAMLSLGRETVLERVVNLFVHSGIENVKIVTGHRREALCPLLKKMPVQEIYNPSYPQGMFSSVQAGVASLEPEVEGFFIMPVDIPLVKVTTIQELVSYYEETRTEILYPCYHGRRGHPPLLSAKLRSHILHWEGPEGLRGLLHEQETKSINITVSDAGILLDIDTPEAYHSLLKLLAGGDV